MANASQLGEVKDKHNERKAIEIQITIRCGKDILGTDPGRRGARSRNLYSLLNLGQRASKQKQTTSEAGLGLARCFVAHE